MLLNESFLKRKQAGFSLLETIIALSILTIGLLGMVTLIIQNIQVKNINEDQMVAAFLCQEGIELTRNIRDDNVLKNLPPYEGISSADGNDYEFIVDYRGVDSLATVSDIDDPLTVLRLNAEKVYSHDSSGAPSKFRRMIITNQADRNAPISVRVIVKWIQSGGDKTYEVESILYNWQ